MPNEHKFVRSLFKRKKAMPEGVQVSLMMEIHLVTAAFKHRLNLHLSFEWFYHSKHLPSQGGHILENGLHHPFHILEVSPQSASLR